MITNQQDTLIILDSLRYKVKEDELKSVLSEICQPEFYYTYYENGLVKFFHSLPVVGNLLSHIAYWAISFVAACKLFLFKKVYRHKIFINPIVAIFYCFILRLFNGKEVILIAGFLFEDKNNKFYLKLRKNFVNYCYKNVSKIIVYSNNEVALYSNWFPDLAAKFVFIRYGRDFDIFEEIEFISTGTYVASGGVSNRDFPNLLKAFKILEDKYPELKCNIATRPQGCAVPADSKNVNVMYNIRIDTFGSFLNKSVFVVIPLANTFISAGHMSLLEAMYQGKIILITDIPAVRDYVNDNMVYFYKPEDAQDLAKKIEYLYLNLTYKELQEKSSFAKEYYLSQFDFKSLLKRIVKLSLTTV